MACQVCGGAIEAGPRFCSACGTRVSLEPPPLYATRFVVPAILIGRVERHLRTLGVLWCVYGGLQLVRGLVGLLVLRTLTPRNFGEERWPFGPGFPPPLPPWLHVLMPVLAVLALVGTALAFATGYALLTRQPWGRTLAIIASVVTLLSPPVGMALGIYTLWALAPAASEIEYRSRFEPPQSRL